MGLAIICIERVGFRLEGGLGSRALEDGTNGGADALGAYF